MECDVSRGYRLNRHVDVTMAKKEAEEEEEDCLFLIILERKRSESKKATKEDSDILTLFFWTPVVSGVSVYQQPTGQTAV